MEKAEMEELKSQIKRDSRRHSKKLITKLKQVVELPEIIEDRIHQEVLYASQDAYRTTMKRTRNGDMKHDKAQYPANGNS
jgi:hypothetical protein